MLARPVTKEVAVLRVGLFTWFHGKPLMVLRIKGVLKNWRLLQDRILADCRHDVVYIDEVESQSFCQKVSSCYGLRQRPILSRVFDVLVDELQHNVLVIYFQVVRAQQLIQLNISQAQNTQRLP